MNTKELTYLLQNPSELNTEQINSLEKLVREFPYFQSIRPLLLKGLKNQESFRYNQELKKTAAYTTDRSVLFDFITSDLFTKNDISSDTKQKHKSEIDVVDPQEIKTLPRVAMDDAVRMKIKEAEDVLDPSLFSTKEEESTLHQLKISEPLTNQTEDTNKKPSADNNKTSEEELKINAPLNFNKKETHSFAEWLKLTSIQPIDNKTDGALKNKSLDSEEKESEKTLDQKEKFNLIDNFITNNPKIKPASKNTPTRNLAKDNTIPTDELMTETLARVYLAQKNYKKAIQAYNILILKNPEKSGFFADQIRAIKKLHENK